MTSERPAELPPEKPAHRHVDLRRDARGRYTVTNARGGTLTVGGDGDFTAVELLLAGIAACTSIDVDYVTSRRAEPEEFDVAVDAEKIADDQGNRLTDVVVTFKVRFPAGAEGDAARRVLPDIVGKSHDRLCTVGRTVMVGTPIRTVVDGS